MTASTLTIIVAVAIVFVVLVWFLGRQRRSSKLRSQFGPEYEHAVREYGSPFKAEDALAARQKRMEKIHVHSLAVNERDAFATQWHDVQSRFVDDPLGAIEKADQLVFDVMRARGYPMSDFERQADDLSVNHPEVVRNYRAAHAIAVQRDRGHLTTEDLRRALVHYRDLFDELLEAHPARRGNSL